MERRGVLNAARTCFDCFVVMCPFVVLLAVCVIRLLFAKFGSDVGTQGGVIGIGLQILAESYGTPVAVSAPS
jgi:hypothetical protein